MYYYESTNFEIKRKKTLRIRIPSESLHEAEKIEGAIDTVSGVLLATINYTSSETPPSNKFITMESQNNFIYYFIIFSIHFILIWLYSSSNVYKYISLIYTK